MFLLLYGFMCLKAVRLRLLTPRLAYISSLDLHKGFYEGSIKSSGLGSYLARWFRAEDVQPQVVDSADR